MVVDPQGAFAYAILLTNSLCPGSTTGIQAFKVNSSGSTTAVGSLAFPEFHAGLAAGLRGPEHDGDGCGWEVSVCGGPDDDQQPQVFMYQVRFQCLPLGVEEA